MIIRGWRSVSLPPEWPSCWPHGSRSPRRRSHPPQPAPDADWPLARGRGELGGLVGGGFNIDWQPQPVNQCSLFLRAGYVLLQQEALVPGSLEIIAEPAYQSVFEGKTANVGSVVALLKYNIRTGTRFIPFVEAGGGVPFGS